MTETVDWLQNGDLDAHVVVRAAMAHLHIVSVHHNTQQYYAVLREVQPGSYQPARDAGPWVRFCVTAHIEQAHQRLEELGEATARWAALEELVESRSWPDRLVIAREQSLFDGAERSACAAGADISLATATSDLRRLLDAGLVTQTGRTRSTRYVASDELRRWRPRKPLV
jgi:Fic family protein